MRSLSKENNSIMTKLVLPIYFRLLVNLDLFHKFLLMFSRVSATGAYVSWIWSCGP